MKKATSILAVILMLSVMAFSLYGCNVSTQVAVGLYKSQASDSCTLKYKGFRGEEEFNLVCTAETGQIEYRAKVESGSVNIYVIQDGSRVKIDDVTPSKGVVSNIITVKGGNFTILITSNDLSRNGEFVFNYVRQ